MRLQLVDVQRKLLAVVIQIWVEEPLHKVLSALAAVLFILCANLLARPYINIVYDVLELLTSFAETWILLFSLLVLYRSVLPIDQVQPLLPVQL